MSVRTHWCDVCRGDAEGSDDLIKCSACPRRFHVECAGLQTKPDKTWSCAGCVDGKRKGSSSSLKARIRAVRAAHASIKSRQIAFYKREAAQLKPFVEPERLKTLKAGAKPKCAALSIGPHEDFVTAKLRPYQVDGVNWILKQYDLGTGGILGDEMGLGKTVQTLTFLAALKAHGLPGPHLVVTPLAVLQNWANEIKRFTPGLSFVKVHGGTSERDRILSDPGVVEATYDIYLTTVTRSPRSNA